ncbi:MAG TPA: hypothetical protein VJ804_05575 [Acidimicrobiales bacterium]|nr:hypothetical protein [Acidimicrobiales bacterium]
MAAGATDSAAKPAPVGDPALHPFERQALIGLALASRPDEDDLRLRLMGSNHLYPSLNESLEDLTVLTERDARLGHRVLALRLLAKLAARRGMDPLRKEERKLRAYLGATAGKVDAEWSHLEGHHRERGAAAHPAVADAGLERPITDAAPEVQRALDGLESAALRRTSSWQSFAPTAADGLQLSDEELGLPRCSDMEHVPVGGVDSIRVVTWFSSPRPIEDFVRWTDPRTWPVDCSLFFQAMIPQGKAPTGEDWTCTFTEKVQVSETKTMVTPLTFTRTAEPGLQAAYFKMPGNKPTADLLVDTGALVVREDPANAPGQRTLFFTEKCVRFVDPALADWPTLLCDLYWMEFSILAALGCRHPNQVKS